MGIQVAIRVDEREVGILGVSAIDVVLGIGIKAQQLQHLQREPKHHVGRRQPIVEDDALLV